MSDIYFNTTKEVVGSAKAMIMESTKLKSQEVWVPKYAEFDGEFLPVVLKRTGGLYNLVCEDAGGQGKALMEVALNSLKSYQIKAKTWHELQQADDSPTIALHFSINHDFEGFYHLLYGLLLGMNKLRDQPVHRLDDAEFYNELVAFQMQPVKLNTLQRAKAGPDPPPPAIPVGPPLPPRKQKQTSAVQVAGSRPDVGHAPVELRNPVVLTRVGRSEYANVSEAKANPEVHFEPVDDEEVYFKRVVKVKTPTVTADDFVLPWCCKCTLLNQARRFSCEACLRDREDAWKCCKCHRIYIIDVAVCSACGVTRCRFCTYQNKPGARGCAMCSEN